MYACISMRMHVRTWYTKWPSSLMAGTTVLHSARAMLKFSAAAPGVPRAAFCKHAGAHGVGEAPREPGQAQRGSLTFNQSVVKQPSRPFIALHAGALPPSPSPTSLTCRICPCPRMDLLPRVRAAAPSAVRS